tara:strand:- start:2056 stop:2898 length:843 start_codon:yes stop_codon:yes gene_type:complete
LIRYIIKILYFNFFLKIYFFFSFLSIKKFFIYKDLIKNIKLTKEADELFIFGSGNSINKLEDSVIENIFDYDTFGFNQAYFSSLPFKYYGFELIESSDVIKNIDEFNNIYINNLLKYLNKVKITQLVIIKDPNIKLIKLYSKFSKIEKKFFLKNFIEIPAHSKQNIESYFRLIKKIERSFPVLKSIKYLDKKRSSLIAYIDLFRRAGYKKITLIGVDLINSKYFFQSDEYKFNNIFDPLPQSQPNMNLHKTEDKKYGDLIFSEILEAYINSHKIEINFIR